MHAENQTETFEEVLLGPALHFHIGKRVDLKLKKACMLYLPVILGPMLDPNKPFIFAHFAQSLDGFIATANGHSKWIGNDINLIHAHRLRALSDSILVGGATLENDHPKLNVRKVEGDDPKRIVISGKAKNFSSLCEASKDEILLLHKSYDQPEVDLNQIRKIPVPTENGIMDPADIAEILKSENHRCIMIEGGAKTIAYFLAASKIDYCQIHISQMYFGSGRSPYQQPEEISEVGEAGSFSFVDYFKMGNAIMMTGYA